MFMKRGQMEMMGMAFVVLLVTLGIIFAVRYVILSPSNSIASEYIRTELPGRLGTSLFHTTLSACHGASLQTVIQDCAESQGSVALIDCSGYSSCVYANATVEAMLQETLVKWNIKHKLVISTPQGILIQKGECFGDQKASRFPIPGRQNSYLNLYIC